MSSTPVKPTERVAASAASPFKMVLCVRTDLDMRKGKMCAQCCHGAIGAHALADKEVVEVWNATGTTKIAVRIKSEAMLDEIYEKALKLGVPAYVVTDEGRTQVEPGSKTVLALGPAARDELDKLTGGLALL